MLRHLILTAASTLQAGCSIFSPLPLWELTKATGTVVGTAVPFGSAKASNTVFHDHAAFRSVCIEYNPQSALPDIVPALQRALRTRQVDSRVYIDTPSLEACSVWLRYTASIAWEIPPLGSDYSAYMKFASLSLQSATGRVLSTSQYELDGAFGVSKWLSTEKKLEPVVAALLTGFQN